MATQSENGDVGTAVIEQIEQNIQAVLNEAKESGPTVVSAGAIIESYEQWQLQLGAWIQTLARAHIPEASSLPLPLIAAATPTAFPITALIDATPATIDAPLPVDQHENASITRRRTFNRIVSHDVAPPAHAASSLPITVPPVDSGRIKPQSYVLRPVSASRRAVQLQGESSFVALHGSNQAVRDGSRFPSLVQEHAVRTIDVQSQLTPLPTASAPSPDTPTSSHTITPTSFVPLPTNPAPPSMAKSPPPPQRPHATPHRSTRAHAVQPTIRSNTIHTIHALVCELERMRAHANTLEERLTRVEKDRDDARRECQTRDKSRVETSTIEVQTLTEFILMPADKVVVSAVTATPTTTHGNNDNATAVTPASPTAAVVPLPSTVSPSAAVIHANPTVRPTTSSGARTLPIGSRPAFVVSTSGPSAPLSLGVTGQLSGAKVGSSSTVESYQARIARESEQRRQAKEAERVRQMAEAQATAAIEAEKDRKRRETIKQQLAQAKLEKEATAKKKLEDDLLAQKQAKALAKEQAMKRQQQKDEIERARKIKEDEETAAANETKKKKSTTQAATPTPVTPAAPTTTPTPPTVEPSAVAIPPAEPVAPPPPVAAVIAPPIAPAPPTAPNASVATKKRSIGVSKKAPSIDSSCQTDPPAPVDDPYDRWLKKHPPSQEELDEDALELAELARMSLKDQIEKLLLDRRYARVRIRGLDEETKGQLQRLQEAKELLKNQTFIIGQQNEELKEWREEGKKMVSTGIVQQQQTDASIANAIFTAPSPTAPSPPPPPSSHSLSSFLSSGDTVPIPPPSLDPALLERPDLLHWLRQLFELVSMSERRRKESERKLAEVIEMGKMAERNLIEAIIEREKMQVRLDTVMKREGKRSI